MLAKAVGLPTVDIQLRQTDRSAIAVIARYDRVLEDGCYRRLHQEDFCQALGISPASKYEKEGGPGLRQCAEIIRRHTSFPLIELQKLMNWTLFNLLAGNADAHGKNLSLLYADRRSLQLAPFYDLVCTRNYKNISRHLAMSLGGVTDPDQIGAKQLHAMADDLGVRATVVLNAATGLSEQLLQTMPDVVNRFGDTFGPSPILERIPIIINKQIRRLTHIASRIVIYRSAYQSGIPESSHASRPEHQDNSVRSPRVSLRQCSCSLTPKFDVCVGSFCTCPSAGGAE